MLSYILGVAMLKDWISWSQNTFRRSWSWSPDLGSTATLVVSLCPYIRRFTISITAWWLRKSSKVTGKKSKNQPENLKIDNF